MKSHHDEIWLRLVKTPKLVDMIRRPWRFSVILVKFKLEVGVDEARLLEIAELSRRHSDADLIVANTPEGMRDVAYVGSRNKPWQRIHRSELPQCLMCNVEDFAFRAASADPLDTGRIRLVEGCGSQ